MPIEVTNDLLQHWPCSPVTSLATTQDQHQLHVGMGLVNFLTALRIHLHDLHHFTGHIEVLRQPLERRSAMNK